MSIEYHIECVPHDDHLSCENLQALFDDQAAQGFTFVGEVTEHLPGSSFETAQQQRLIFMKHGAAP